MGSPMGLEVPTRVGGPAPPQAGPRVSGREADAGPGGWGRPRHAALWPAVNWNNSVDTRGRWGTPSPFDLSPGQINEVLSINGLVEGGTVCVLSLRCRASGA